MAGHWIRSADVGRVLRAAAQPRRPSLWARLWAAWLVEATGWQKHSIRGWISTANKKGHQIELQKDEHGKRYVALAGK
jgi:hypothetical protein